MSVLKELRFLHTLNKNQWKNIKELRDIQNKKIRTIVNYAYENVPFYHNLLKNENIHPSEIKTRKDLNKIPLVSKKDLKENYPNNIISEEINLKKCIIWNTSGSTGIPLNIPYNKIANDYARAVIARSYISNGLKYFDKWCVIGSPDYQKQKFKGYSVIRKLRLLAPLYISVFASVEEKVKILKKFKPRVIDSLPTDLFLITKYIEKNKIDDIKPKIITTNGEILDNYVRKYIEDYFVLKISDMFGCFELRRTAWECPNHEGYHIDIDSIVMQFIKNGEEVSFGEEGNIVYTGLYNQAMPLIRYDIGDIGTPLEEMCSCKRGLPLMKITGGKIMDFLTTVDGNLISPHVPKEFIASMPSVHMFKLTQIKKDLINIQIVKNDIYNKNFEERLRIGLKKILGKELQIKIVYVKELGRDKNKYKVIESKIPFKILK